MGDFNNTGTVYRVIKRSKPDTLKRKNGKIVGVSSALFKDENGVSVDLKKERTEADAIEELKNFFKKRLKGIVSLSESDILDAEAILLPTPSDDLPYHAEIHKSYDEILLDDIQALQLADACTLILFDENVAWTQQSSGYIH